MFWYQSVVGTLYFFITNIMYSLMKLISLKKIYTQVLMFLIIYQYKLCMYVIYKQSVIYSKYNTDISEYYYKV